MLLGLYVTFLVLIFWGGVVLITSPEEWKFWAGVGVLAFGSIFSLLIIGGFVGKEEEAPAKKAAPANRAPVKPAPAKPAPPKPAFTKIPAAKDVPAGDGSPKPAVPTQAEPPPQSQSQPRPQTKSERAGGPGGAEDY